MGAEPLLSSGLAQTVTVTLAYPTPTSRLLGTPQGRLCISELSMAIGLAWAGICRGYLDAVRGRESQEVQGRLGMGSGFSPLPPLPQASVSSSVNRPEQIPRSPPDLSYEDYFIFIFHF